MNDYQNPYENNNNQTDSSSQEPNPYYDNNQQPPPNSYYTNNAYQQNTYGPGDSWQQPPPVKGASGMSIASLVLGIASVFLSCIPVFPFLVGVVGVILGIVSLVKKNNGKGMAIAGIICGSIGIVFSVFITLVFAIASTKSFLEDIYYYYRYY